MEINKQIAIISGGASGMGAQVARHLAKLGAKVIILDRNIQAAQEVAKTIDAKSIDDIAIACDITDAAVLEKAYSELKQKYGAPRICVNCAGICPGKLIVGKNGQAMPLSDFSQVIQVNLIGTFNLMRLAAAGMSELAPIGENEERGVIINTASIAAYEGQIGQAAYSASKGGVVSMTLPAARELARFGIRVLSIAPGLIETPMLHGLEDKVRENLIATMIFPKRLGKVDEFAMLVQHMIENPMLNGCTVRLDGALRMAPK